MCSETRASRSTGVRQDSRINVDTRERYRKPLYSDTFDEIASGRKSAPVSIREQNNTQYSDHDAMIIHYTKYVVIEVKQCLPHHVMMLHQSLDLVSLAAKASTGRN